MTEDNGWLHGLCICSALRAQDDNGPAIPVTELTASVNYEACLASHSSASVIVHPDPVNVQLQPIEGCSAGGHPWQDRAQRPGRCHLSGRVHGPTCQGLLPKEALRLATELLNHFARQEASVQYLNPLANAKAH